MPADFEDSDKVLVKATADDFDHVAGIIGGNRAPCDKPFDCEHCSAVLTDIGEAVNNVPLLEGESQRRFDG